MDFEITRLAGEPSFREDWGVTAPRTFREAAQRLGELAVIMAEAVVEHESLREQSCNGRTKAQDRRGRMEEDTETMFSGANSFCAADDFAKSVTRQMGIIRSAR